MNYLRMMNIHNLQNEFFRKKFILKFTVRKEPISPLIPDEIYNKACFN